MLPDAVPVTIATASVHSRAADNAFSHMKQLNNNNITKIHHQMFN